MPVADAIPLPPATVPAAATFPETDLLRRYDRPGPRYTSYPTALEFDPRFGEADYRAAAARCNAGAGRDPLSLYVHIPFCASPCFFCGCTKVITRQMPLAETYLERLYREIERQSMLFPRSRVVEQLHLGGGTPTFLSAGQLADLMGHLGRHFALSSTPEREFSIEIDPRTVTTRTLSQLPDIGFNRVSLGVQDFDPAVQAAVNRVQPAAQTMQLIDAAKRGDFKSISVDLIYGLPLQTEASFERTLDLLLAARPDRIAAYSYAHLPQRFKPQRRIRTDQLPSPEEKLALLQLTVRRLTGAGYVYIGMDHFALPGDELVKAAERGDLQRNFQGYSTHGDTDLIGFGMSAIGRIGESYAQNARSLTDYCAAIDADGLAIRRGLRLSAEDLLRRDVIAALMCRGQLRFSDVEARHAIDFAAHFSREVAALQTLAADGLVTLEADRIQVTAAGRYLLRAVAMVFDAYLSQPAAPAAVSAPPRYSRVV
ncbi:MAG: oxygen-independent coproporphyrinogen III oxidase [Gammaproteobacteria bacterium]|nr:oxygen-independent coproporphyrinogen III oxidase [Gammaproteobacteria bacterium]